MLFGRGQLWGVASAQDVLLTCHCSVVDELCIVPAIVAASSMWAHSLLLWVSVSRSIVNWGLFMDTLAQVRGHRALWLLLEVDFSGISVRVDRPSS